MKKGLLKTLSFTLAFSIVFTSIHLSESAVALASPGLQRFAPPSSLGHLVETYAGPDPRTVVLVQDLHINYEAQKHIAGLLEVYAKKNLLPPFVAIEGAEGPVDASNLTRFPDPRLRRDLADYFVRKGELTGAGAYTAESGNSDLLYGVEKGGYYELQKSLFQKTFESRKALAKEAERLETSLQALKKHEYTRDMRKLEGMYDTYEMGKLTTGEYAQALLSRANAVGLVFDPHQYPALEIIRRKQFPEHSFDTPTFIKSLGCELEQFSLDLRKFVAKTHLQRNLVQADYDLNLLKRLLKQQTTEEEVRTVGTHLARFVSTLGDLLEIESGERTRVEQVVRDAMDFYILAAVREKPMFENTLARMGVTQTSVGVLVAGGFHTAGLKTLLRSRGISYAVIAPVIKDVKAEDETLYEQRLLDHHVTVEEVLADRAEPESRGSARLLTQGNYVLNRIPYAQRLANSRAVKQVYDQIAPAYPLPENLEDLYVRNAYVKRVAPEIERRLGFPLALPIIEQDVNRLVLAIQAENHEMKRPGHLRKHWELGGPVDKKLTTRTVRATGLVLITGGELLKIFVPSIAIFTPLAFLAGLSLGSSLLVASVLSVVITGLFYSLGFTDKTRKNFHFLWNFLTPPRFNLSFPNLPNGSKMKEVRETRFILDVAKALLNADQTRPQFIGKVLAELTGKKVQNYFRSEREMTINFTDGASVVYKYPHFRDSQGSLEVIAKDQTQGDAKKLRDAAFDAVQEVFKQMNDHALLFKKFITPLRTDNDAMAERFSQGGYGQDGHGVGPGMAVDGSHTLAVDEEYFDKTGEAGGYYTRINGQKVGQEAFLDGFRKFHSFFNKHREWGKPIRYVIKIGIGGQHTPHAGLAQAFSILDTETGMVVGEYELGGQDYEAVMEKALRDLGFREGEGWDQIAVIVSSKSGKTDETMVIFEDIFHILLKKLATQLRIPGQEFADLVFDVLHDLNFPGGTAVSDGDLFKVPKGTNLLKMIEAKAKEKGLKKADLKNIKTIFRNALSHMVFETTDRPAESRLAAFIKNSQLDEVLGQAYAPVFIPMFENVGGRWTADLHMMALLAYYGLHEGVALRYWESRQTGIQQVHQQSHIGNNLGFKIVDEQITDIGWVVPYELWWLARAIEQNWNESIARPEGSPNLVPIKQSDWEKQQVHYKNQPHKLVVNMSTREIDPTSFNVFQLRAPELRFGPDKAREDMLRLLVDDLADIITTVYGATNTAGLELIRRQLDKNNFSVSDVDMNNLDNEATKVVQRLSFLRQEFVEMGKKVAARKLKGLQEDPGGVENAQDRRFQQLKKEMKDGRYLVVGLEEVTLPNDIKESRTLERMIRAVLRYSQKKGRKFIPVLYLGGDTFLQISDRLTGEVGLEAAVQQGTAFQHISLQQYLAQAQNSVLFVVSAIPNKLRLGHRAIGLAPQYYDRISPDLARHIYAESIFEAVKERKGAAVFLTIPEEPRRNAKFNSLVDAFSTVIHSDPSLATVTRAEFPGLMHPETIADSYNFLRFSLGMRNPPLPLVHLVGLVLVPFEHFNVFNSAYLEEHGKRYKGLHTAYKWILAIATASAPFIAYPLIHEAFSSTLTGLIGIIAAATVSSFVSLPTFYLGHILLDTLSFIVLWSVRGIKGLWTSFVERRQTQEAEMQQTAQRVDHLSASTQRTKVGIGQTLRNLLSLKPKDAPSKAELQSAENRLQDVVGRSA